MLSEGLLLALRDRPTDAARLPTCYLALAEFLASKGSRASLGARSTVTVDWRGRGRVAIAVAGVPRAPG